MPEPFYARATDCGGTWLYRCRRSAMDADRDCRAL